MDGREAVKATPAGRVAGNIPYRMAFAGGWIDQPFLSRLNPDPDGSMVVVCLEPEFRFMDRCGMATSSRKVAERLWGDVLPPGDPEELVRLLYREENGDSPEPSGSQDMIGLIYPGVSRLDYDAGFEGGFFPRHIENCRDPVIARWLEDHIRMVPVAPRPESYNPLEVRNLDPGLIRDLGRTGRDCYTAILEKNPRDLGRSMNLCMELWEAILPGTVRHSSLTVDLKGILRYYQDRYDGAMYSGCGGGYLYVVCSGDIPGGLRVKVRTGESA